ncbi:MAG: tetratricopeptide repeat protein, partial [Bacteroidetes bacterium]|nr:tetratricopeptide repeat protein [Bacteroidota bacterium]
MIKGFYRYCLFVVFAVALGIVVYGAEESDSMEIWIQKTADNREKVHQLLLMAAKADPTEAITIYEGAYKISRVINYYKGAFNSLVLTTAIHSETGEFSYGLEKLYQALSLSQEAGDSVDVATTYQSFGYLYDYNEEYEKALEFYLKARELYLKTENLKEAELLAGGIGSVYGLMGKYKAALFWDSMAIQIAIKYEDRSLASNYNNIGTAYKGLGEFKKAMKFYRKALNLMKRKGAKEISLSSVNNNIADTHIRLNSFDS